MLKAPLEAAQFLKPAHSINKRFNHILNTVVYPSSCSFLRSRIFEIVQVSVSHFIFSRPGVYPPAMFSQQIADLLPPLLALIHASHRSASLYDAPFS